MRILLCQTGAVGGRQNIDPSLFSHPAELRPSSITSNNEGDYTKHITPDHISGQTVGQDKHSMVTVTYTGVTKNGVNQATWVENTLRDMKNTAKAKLEEVAPGAWKRTIDKLMTEPLRTQYSVYTDTDAEQKLIELLWGFSIDVNENKNNSVVFHNNNSNVTGILDINGDRNIVENLDLSFANNNEGQKQLCIPLKNGNIEIPDPPANQKADTAPGVGDIVVNPKGYFTEMLANGFPNGIERSNRNMFLRPARLGNYLEPVGILFEVTPKVENADENDPSQWNLSVRFFEEKDNVWIEGSPTENAMVRLSGGGGKKLDLNDESDFMSYVRAALGKNSQRDIGTYNSNGYGNPKIVQRVISAYFSNNKSQLTPANRIQFK